MKPLFLLVAACLLGIGFLGTLASTTDASGGTDVGGIISANTTWSIAGSPYRLTSNVQIAYGATLTIQPGVTVHGQGKDIQTWGVLSAVGASGNRIHFDNVTIYGGSSQPSEHFSIQLQYTEIISSALYGATGNAIYGNLILRDSIIRDAAVGSYIYLWYPVADCYIERNVFANTGGISTGHSDNVKVYIRNNAFVQQTGNSVDMFAIENWSSSGTSETIVEKNSFFSTDRVALRLPPGYSSARMTTTNNYWNTTSTSDIAQMIFDKHDDLGSAGYIEFDPFLTSPDPNTPPYPHLPTLTPTASLTPTITETPTFTETPTLTATPTRSPTPTATFLPDNDPPIIESMDINAGALTTTSSNNVVGVTASDTGSGVSELQLSNDGTQWSDWQDYANTVEWQIEGGDGLHTVYLRVRDQTGNVSNVATHAIQLDTTVSTEYSLSINHGALYTNQTGVILSIGARPVTSKMEVSNDGGFSVPIEPYDSQKEWTITAYDGSILPRTVYVRFRDYAGNVVGTVTDDIILDVNAPTGNVNINPGGSLTEATANVQLQLKAKDDLSGVSQMRISNKSDLKGAKWQPFRKSRSWSLAGNQAVFVQFKDNAGNVSKTYASTTCTGAPAKPKPLSPADSSIVTTAKVSLDWSDARCATQFSLEVRKDSPSGQVITNRTKMPASQFELTQLENAQSYYWRAGACNKVKCVSGMWASFTVDVP